MCVHECEREKAPEPRPSVLKASPWFSGGPCTLVCARGNNTPRVCWALGRAWTSTSGISREPGRPPWQASSLLFPVSVSLRRKPGPRGRIPHLKSRSGGGREPGAPRPQRPELPHPCSHSCGNFLLALPPSQPGAKAALLGGAPPPPPSGSVPGWPATRPCRPFEVGPWNLMRLGLPLPEPPLQGPRPGLVASVFKETGEIPGPQSPLGPLKATVSRSRQCPWACPGQLGLGRPRPFWALHADRSPLKCPLCHLPDLAPGPVSTRPALRSPVRCVSPVGRLAPGTVPPSGPTPAPYPSPPAPGPHWPCSHPVLHLPLKLAGPGTPT